MKSLRALCLATPLLVGPGCAATMVVTPAPADIARIQPGMNRTEVLNLLGLPNDVEKRVSEEGAVTWIWTYDCEAYGVASVPMPYKTLHFQTSQPQQGARIIWSPEGTVAEIQLPQVQR